MFTSRYNSTCHYCEKAIIAGQMIAKANSTDYTTAHKYAHVDCKPVSGGVKRAKFRVDVPGGKEAAGYTKRFVREADAIMEKNFAGKYLGVVAVITVL